MKGEGGGESKKTGTQKVALNPILTRSRALLGCLTLSLRRGGGCCNPPFRIFPRAVFAFLLRLPYGPFTHPLSRYPCICEKNFQKFCHEKSWGVGGGVATTPRPEREGVAAKKKFCNFHFLLFSFCHNNDYVPEILKT